MPRRQNQPKQTAATARDRIQSRKPTGKVTWPCILVEGEEKSGKTWLAYLLSKSDRIGPAFVIDLGEGTADEYAVVGDYEVLVADPDRPLDPWTFPKLIDQVKAVRDFAREEVEAGRPPVLLMIDTMSDEWGVLVDAITAKASMSEKNRKLLADDPAAEVRVPNHLWNDANAKHRRLMTLLLTFPGIVVLTARGKDVAEIRNGEPVAGSRVWKVEGQKNLPFDVSAWIRMKRDSEPTLEGCRSVHIGLRPGIDAARKMTDVAANIGHERASFREGGLEWFIFQALQLDPATAAVRDLRTLTDDGKPLDGGDVPQSVDQMLARVAASWNHPRGLYILLDEIVARGYADHQVLGPDKEHHPFGLMVAARADELNPDSAETPEGAGEAQGAPQEPPAGSPGPDGPPADLDAARRLREAAAQDAAK